MKATVTGNGRKVLMVDSAGKIFEFDKDGSVLLELPTDGGSFETWRVGENYLYCHLGGSKGHGVRMVTRDNETVMEYLSDSEIFTCQPIEDGKVLVGELTAKRLVEVDKNGEIVAVIPVKSAVDGHEVMRMARKQADGTYWVVHPGDRAIRGYDAEGTVLWEVPTRRDTFAAIPYNGHIMYTSQTAIVETDFDGNEIWVAEKEDLEPIGPKWLTGMELAKNGNLLVCNWLGHGFEGQGVPLFEINRDKEIVWKLEAPSFTFDPANLKEME